MSLRRRHRPNLVFAHGRCCLRFNGKIVELATGDVLVFPRGDKHTLLDKPNTEPVPGQKVLEAHMRARSRFSPMGMTVHACSAGILNTTEPSNILSPKSCPP